MVKFLSFLGQNKDLLSSISNRMLFNTYLLIIYITLCSVTEPWWLEVRNFSMSWPTISSLYFMYQILAFALAHLVFRKWNLQVLPLLDSPANLWLREWSATTSWPIYGHTILHHDAQNTGIQGCCSWWEGKGTSKNMATQCQTCLWMLKGLVCINLATSAVFP